MMNVRKNKARERVKTVLIVLLAVTAVLLGALTGLFNGLAGTGFNLKRALSGAGEGRSLPLAPADAGAETGAAAMPVYAVVTGAQGAHYAVKYSSPGILGVYDDSATLLSEAIGSAARETASDENAWKKALGEAGIYFDYRNALPLGTIASWLGVGSGGVSERNVRRLCVCASDGAVWLSYRDEDTGEFFRCRTASAEAEIESIVSSYPPNGAVFAWEAGEEFAQADPYMIVTREKIRPREYSAKAPSAIYAQDSAVHAFGINPYSSYTETDGTQVYVETGCTLRVSPDGHVAYRASDGRDSAAVYGDMSGAVEYGRKLAAETIGADCGEAEVYLTSVKREGNGFTLTFDYFIDGIEVRHTAAAHAAGITLSGGFVTSAELYYRSYTPLSEQLDVWPEHIAAAAAQSGEEPTLVYFDAPGTDTRAGWTV